MNKLLNYTLSFSLLPLLLVAGLATTPAVAEIRSKLGAFAPLPESSVKTTDTPELIALGKKLYFEKRLSRAGDLTCNSCHDLNRFGVDNQPTSLGDKGQRGDRNSPTVFNAALHVAQFWDGRAASLEEQALGPMMNPVEMAMPSEEVVVSRLTADKEYPGLFTTAFPGEKPALTFQNVGRAIAAFERTLVTPSRFDAYLKGQDSALNVSEQKGLELFVDSGCVACHSGVGIGGSMFQKLGMVKPYETEDLGRFKVTNQESDKFVFKVPSLRNIEKTGPYFHDGSVESLEEAVKLMGAHQLGRTFEDTEVTDLVAFLRTLTGTPPVL